MSSSLRRDVRLVVSHHLNGHKIGCGRDGGRAHSYRRGEGLTKVKRQYPEAVGEQQQDRVGTFDGLGHGCA